MSQNTFKVAISNRNILGKNGASRIILEQARRFVDLDAEVYLYVSRYNKKIIPQGIKIKHFFSLNPIKKIRREKFAYKFKNFCNSLDIDLSIGNGDTIDQNVLFMHNLVELESKLVYRIENCLSSVCAIHDKILKRNKFKLLICNSNLMKNYIQEKYKIQNHKIAVVYPGYDPKKFNLANKDAIREKFKRDYKIKTDFIIGFITSGNLKKRGIDTFLEILLYLPERTISKITFIIVGKEKKFNSYLSRYQQFKNNIIYIEPLEDVENIIKSLDILLHPAIIEEFGMVVLETLACGVPVITSNMVGASEIFGDNLAELILKDASPSSFAYALVDILDEPYKLSKLSYYSQQIAKNFTWNEYFKNLFEIYTSKNLIPNHFVKS